MAKRSKKRVYARIITPLMLIRWQLYAISIGVLINIMISWWTYELSLLQVQGMINKTSTAVEVCNEIGWKDCKTIRDILKERNGD